MPVYSIQRDPPWIPPPDAGIATKSTIQAAVRGQGQAVPSPRSNPSYHASYHAHPQQQIQDSGPQLRQSRLPLFKHVRSMLHKPPPITTPSHPGWSLYHRGRSDSAHATGDEPSTYVSPFDGAFKSSRKRSPRKDQSPVSVLNDGDLTAMDRVPEEELHDADRSPVSPVSAPSLAEDESDDDLDKSLLPEPLSPNIQRAPAVPGPRTPPNPQIKRKPVSRDFSVENYPPQHSRSPSGDLSSSPPGTTGIDWAAKKSHFSWTTCATSSVPGRPSIDTVATRPIYEAFEVSKSRFSWSTLTTNSTQRVRPQTPPPNPPPIPEHAAGPPMQSILSRRRPVQRVEKEEWNPPPPPARSNNHHAFPSRVDSLTATSATTLKAVQPSTPPTTTASPTSTATKALPPPPEMSSSNNLNHMETLLAQERDIVLQRRNVERGIDELVKIEKASPLDVNFATVRDAKKRLAEYRARLDEVRLEERGIGIAISRARRREEMETGGDGETLWVRRITG